MVDMESSAPTTAPNNTLLRHGRGLSTESNIRHGLLVNNHYKNMHSHIAILEVACELTGLDLTVQLDPISHGRETSCTRRVDANSVKKNTLHVC